MHGPCQIGKLYAIERELKHLVPEERAACRRQRAGPILTQFKGWLEATYVKSPPKSAIGNALAYSINRWPALTRYLDDGWLNIDNNPVENAIRGIAGRRSLCTSFSTV
jgi:transposase